MREIKKNKMANIGQKWLELLIPFSFNYKIKLTASEISRMTKISLRTCSRALNNLVEINLLRYIIDGKNKTYYFDLNNPQILSLVHIIESFKSLKYSFIDEIYLPLIDIIKKRETVLFGSRVKDYSTKESDIDILIMGKEDKKIKDFARRNKLNVHFSTVERFEKMLMQKNSLALEIIENHVVFGGSQFLGVCWRYYYG